MSAKSKARAQLGSEDKYIDLDGLNEERRIAKTTYNTNKNKLMTDYNDQISGLNADRADNRRAFDAGRHTVGTQAYFANKTNKIKDRNLGSLSQLRRLGTEMAVDRANSDVANTYYNNAESLDLREKGYTNDYNSGLEAIKNALDSSLASIKSRENALRNEYRAKVATLAEQIQARMDNKAWIDFQQKMAEDNAMNDLVNKIAENNNKLATSTDAINAINQLASYLRSEGKNPPTLTDKNGKVVRMSYGDWARDIIINKHSGFNMNRYLQQSKQAEQELSKSQQPVPTGREYVIYPTYGTTRWAADKWLDN